MEQQQLQLLQKTFDDIKHENGTDFWYARELAPKLGYVRWENFENAISRAKDACRTAGGNILDHFRDVTKTVKTGLDKVEKNIPDIKLTRYASYLISLNGDPRKEEVAFAQAYFVSQTRKLEVLQQRMAELERLDAREKLKITEKEFGDMVFGRGVDGSGIAFIRNAGDQALFGVSTAEMKQKLGVSKGPLADFLPNVTLKAKDLATAMTMENTRNKNLRGSRHIANEHIETNSNVRGALTKANIFPENLPPSEDIKLIESRHRKERKELEQRQREELDQAARQLKG